MAGYREKWWQLGRKKLPFPEYIVKKINNQTISLEEYLELKIYEQGVEIDCIVEPERKVIEKFGLEKLKNLDLELIKALRGWDIDYIEVLMNISESVEDVNMAFYEAVKDSIPPGFYSTSMRKVYTDRVLEIDSEDENLRKLKSSFETGYLTVYEIIRNWQIFKDKDLSFCLSRDSFNKDVGITDSELKKFMNEDMDKFRGLYELATRQFNKIGRAYGFIHEIANAQNEDLKVEVAYKYADNILEADESLGFSREDYNKVFRYFPLTEYLKRRNGDIGHLVYELNNLPKDYVDNMPIPIPVLRDRSVLSLLNSFGLRNIVDFDNECGHFFSKNNYEMLRYMRDMYPILDFPFNRNPYYVATENDEDNKPHIYTKEEFYEAMKRIILYGARILTDYETISGEFRDKNPDLFIDEKAPDELKKAFYNRELTPSMITKLVNEKNIEFLRGKHISAIMLPIANYGRRLYECIEQDLNFEDVIKFIVEHGDILEKINTYKISSLRLRLENAELLRGSLLDVFFSDVVVHTGCPYPKNVPDDVKSTYKTMFLGDDAPPELQKKFYSRSLAIEDFNNHPDWIKYFDNTNVSLGFPENIAWLNPLFSFMDRKEANRRKLIIITEFLKIPDLESTKVFKSYIERKGHTIAEDKIKYVSELLNRLYYSNSTEMHSFRKSFAEQLLETDEPIENCKKIEKIFLQNNLPLFGKMFLTFQILYPNFANQKFQFGDESRMAPELKNSSLPNVGHGLAENETRFAIIFNDLLRIAYCSRERSLMDYLKNIEVGNEIFLHLQKKDYTLNDLSPEMMKVLEVFVSHLEMLYENTPQGKNEQLDISGLSIEAKLQKFSELFKTTNLYDLKDRIVRTYCFTAGVRSFEELKKLIVDNQTESLERRRKIVAEIEANGGVFEFKPGDFVRGIGDYKSLSGSLELGNLCKEHLGSILGKSESDTTPLDIDVTLVTESKDIFHTIEGTPTGFGFGNVFLIFKKDNPRLNVTRDAEGHLTGAEYDPRKVEAFGTQVGEGGYITHWGFRTGCSIKSDPDLILYKQDRMIYDSKPYNDDGTVNYVEDKSKQDVDYDYDLQAIKFALAKEGTYIPIIDFSGRLIFTEKEFNLIRSKMQGLSYYGETTYQISDNLVTPDIERIAGTINDDSVKETVEKRAKVCNIIAPVLKKFNLETRYNLGDDLTTGSAELIDTGSTGRNTNIPHEGDFDFFMRLDADIIRDPNRMQQLRDNLIEAMKAHEMDEAPKITDSGDLRFKGVTIALNTKVDVDISFGVKTNKVTYSSDLCLQDRLNTIKATHPDKYKYVVANIILAKEVLKKAGVYKNRRSDESQGGLGGIGIENWILQNGGSFVDAAKSFVEKAEGKSFAEFKKVYQLWDFGENHFAARKGEYLYDNFIANNMNENGYNKMVAALKEYLKALNYAQDDTVQRKV